MATWDLGKVVGADGKSATLEITGVQNLPYGSDPVITEEVDSTPLVRKYRLGIPAGKPGTNAGGGGAGIDDGAIATDTTYSSVKIEAIANQLSEQIDDLTASDVGAMPSKPSSIELTGSVGHGGYIDFHFGNTSADYTSRLWETEEGKITVSGDLNVENNLLLNNTNVLLKAYPAGSIYMSTNSTSPASLFGGTWEQLKDRFLLGAGGSYTAGGTGGESTHKLTTAEMPAHTHKDRIQWMSSGTSTTNVATVDGKPIAPANGVAGHLVIDAADQGSIGSTGGGGAHNNMPPYLAVYMWKRVS